MDIQIYKRAEKIQTGIGALEQINAAIDRVGTLGVLLETDVEEFKKYGEKLIGLLNTLMAGL